MTFGTKDIYCTENIILDVAYITMPYNGIIWLPALAKFMVVTHHAYNSLKLPSPWGTLTVKGDVRDVVPCSKQLFQIAATAFPVITTHALSNSDRESVVIMGKTVVAIWNNCSKQSRASRTSPLKVKVPHEEGSLSGL